MEYIDSMLKRMVEFNKRGDIMRRQEVARKLLENDIRGILDIIANCSGETSTHFALGGLLYFATIISGALDWCEKANINAKCFTDRDVIEKLRAKVKLYASDNIIPLQEQKVLMSSIVEIEKQYWIDCQAKSGKKCPICWIPDVGAYCVNGHYIGNTLEYAYEYSPLNPEKKPILAALGGSDKESSAIYQFAIQLGQTLQNLHTLVVGQRYLWSKGNADTISVQDCDFRMSNHKFFKNDNAIFAFNLCCRINYLLEILIPLCEHNSLLAFRLTYITFYHLKFDLENLGLEKIYYEMPYRNKIFRNAMAHYSLFGKISDAEIDEHVIGYGLFEKFFNVPFQTVNEAMVIEQRKTRDSLEQYVVI